MQQFYSNGKLLLTGEYVILDGAIGLAIPTAYGQALQVRDHENKCIKWQSVAVDGSIWFHADLDAYSLEILETSDIDTAKVLQTILRQATKLNQSFLFGSQGYDITARLNFNRRWGLGSSSTLINNIAQWAKVDAYQLLWNAFSGSGYDIACAQHNSPILYQLSEQKPQVTALHFNPIFKDKLFFIYLNTKQNSRDGIAQYRAQHFDKPELIRKISDITKEIVSCKNLQKFEALLNYHETLIAENLNLETVKSALFSDFSGSIKSLGAWGGDFILATGDKNTSNYFIKKGYNTVIPFSKMILKST